MLPICMGILAGGMAVLPVAMRALHPQTGVLSPEIGILAGESRSYIKEGRSMHPRCRLCRLKRELWVLRCGLYIRKGVDSSLPRRPLPLECEC